MIINKLERFYTNRESQELEKLRNCANKEIIRVHDNTNEMANLLPWDPSKSEELNKINASGDRSLEILMVALDGINQINDSATERYIESFSNNPRRILDDVKEVIEQITWDDFEKTQARNLDLWSNGDDKAIKDFSVFFTTSRQHCIGFLNELLIPQKKALQYYIRRDPEGLEDLANAYKDLPENPDFSIDIISKLIIDKANQLFKEGGQQASSAAPTKKPRKKPHKPLKESIPNFYSMPSSKPAHYLLTSLSMQSPEAMDLFAARYNATYRDRQMLIQQSNGQIRLVLGERGENGDIYIEQTTPMITGKNSSRLNRFICYLLTKYNQWEINENGEIVIRFTIKNYREAMDYSINGAALSLKNQVDKLLGVKVYYKRRGENDQEILGGRAIFAGIERDGNEYKVILSSPSIWKELVKQTASLPAFILKLHNRDFDLGYYISYLARQNGASLKKNRQFAISFESICMQMGFPDISADPSNARKLILDPLEKSVEAINNHPDNKDYSLTLEYNPRQRISTILKEGKLIVKMSENAARSAIEAADKREQHKTNNTKTKKKQAK